MDGIRKPKCGSPHKIGCLSFVFDAATTQLFEPLEGSGRLSSLILKGIIAILPSFSLFLFKNDVDTEGVVVPFEAVKFHGVPAGTTGVCSLKYSGKRKSKSLPNNILAFVVCKSLSEIAKSVAMYLAKKAIRKGDHASGAVPKILYSIG